MKRRLLSDKLLDQYKKHQKYSILKHLNSLHKMYDETLLFAFTKSSVFSSMIEGSKIDMSNYLFNKETKYQNSEMQQIDDLVKGYDFAKGHELNYNNILEVHKIVSSHFNIAPKYKGVIRDREVNIQSLDGKLVYSGCQNESLENELKAFFTEIQTLKNRRTMTYNEAFYYAALGHLIFVDIHPFADGNGRMSRLIEKWILNELIDDSNVWKIPSEINYWLKREKYYRNLNKLGKSYETLDYSKALDFLLMLPSSFGVSKKYYK